jgi:hypothetical protein
LLGTSRRTVFLDRRSIRNQDDTLKNSWGDLNGFIRLKGSAQKLAEIRRDSAFLDLVVESQYCLEGFGVSYKFMSDGHSAVPEPCTMLLLGPGMVGVLELRKKFKEIASVELEKDEGRVMDRPAFLRILLVSP